MRAFGLFAAALGLSAMIFGGEAEHYARSRQAASAMAGAPPPASETPPPNLRGPVDFAATAAVQANNRDEGDR